MYGAPSQLETLDPKPEAPQEIRGEFGSIPSVLPDVRIGELLPKLAKVIDRATILRTVSHPYPIHGVAYALTGIPRIDVAAELSPRDPNHWPFAGSVVAEADGRRSPIPPEIPRNLLLPFAFSSQRVGEVPRAGPYGGFLGSKADPIPTVFRGEANRTAQKTLAEKKWEGLEPYRGITAESRFSLEGLDAPSDGVTLNGLSRRRSLLDQIESARQQLGGDPIDGRRQQAYTLLSSPKLRRAFALEDEPMPLREAYGLTLFGQATLTARRLVEAGGRFISVFWDEYGLAGTGWDTHWDHFARMKDELTPGLDAALSALLTDLDTRGLLDETLVLCLSEHGRTPTLSRAQGGGRDHWSKCYSVLLAGGGIARGRVVGRSDKTAGEPADRPVSPKDILATAYHLLGVDPETTFIDRLGRPQGLVADGRVVPELLA
ncbi:MAG: DUF1501 domain-containing protein [Isosphaeraceae bacterium]